MGRYISTDNNSINYGIKLGLWTEQGAFSLHAASLISPEVQNFVHAFRMLRCMGIRTVSILVCYNHFMELCITRTNCYIFRKKMHLSVTVLVMTKSSR